VYQPENRKQRLINQGRENHADHARPNFTEEQRGSPQLATLYARGLFS